jgi:nitronate monooxygenase
MTVPALLTDAPGIPANGAPMFLLSSPPLVNAPCKVGLTGAFPHVNAPRSPALAVAP